MKVKLVLLLLVVLMLAGFVPVLQGTQRFKEIIAESLTVSKNASITGDLTVGDDTIMTGDLTVGGNMPGRSLLLRYQDVGAAPAIFAQATAAATVVALPTGEFLGIETPRNLKVTYTTATTATAGSLTVTGIDARGASATDIIAVGAVSGTQTLLGVVPFVSISTITLPTGRTEDIDITIAGGQKIGLPFVPEAAGDVYLLTVNITPQPAPTVNTTYGTFDPVSTPAANSDYNVWIKQ